MCRCVLAIVALLAGCGNPPSDPDLELREWLSFAESEVESRDARALMRRIADGYADARGHSRDDVERLVRIYFHGRQKVALLTSVDSIEVYGDDAAGVMLTVAMAGAGAGGTAGWSADAYRFALDLERRDGEWLLIGARWGQLGGPLR